MTGSDIVICIAAATEPVVDGDWVSPGATVIGAGPTTWRVQEGDRLDLARADKVFVDSADQAPIEAGDMASAVDRGLFQWSRMVELRHAVAGMVAGRDNPEQVIFAKLNGHRGCRCGGGEAGLRASQGQGLGVEMEW